MTDRLIVRRGYSQPLEFRPHSYFVDFTSHALFYIMTSCPAFIKVGKTPATQNFVLEQYAVKIGNSTLFLYDKILASCYRFSCYYRFSDIAINSVNPSFI